MFFWFHFSIESNFVTFVIVCKFSTKWLASFFSHLHIKSSAHFTQGLCPVVSRIGYYIKIWQLKICTGKNEDHDFSTFYPHMAHIMPLLTYCYVTLIKLILSSIILQNFRFKSSATLEISSYLSQLSKNSEIASSDLAWTCPYVQPILYHWIT